MDFLKVTGLQSGYPNNTVIKGVSFDAHKSEFIGIIGPNGAGKTTLLKTLCHIIRPTAGKVLLEGNDVHRMSVKSVAKKIAMAAEGFTSVFSFNVEEIVLMGRNPYIGVLGHESKTDLDKALNALRLTGMEKFRHRPVEALSAGEKQRVVIARALAQEPRLLLLDEPTAHLDIGYQIDILDLIDTLRKKQAITVVCVFHDLNLASQYCSKLILLDRGAIIDFDTPEKILKYDLLEDVFNASCVVDYKILGGRPVVIPFTRRV